MPSISSAAILASSPSSISSAILPNQGVLPFFGFLFGEKLKVADPSGFSVFSTPLIRLVRGFPFGKLTVDGAENGFGAIGSLRGIVPVLIWRTI
jgi:hypothetical protein